MSQIACPHCSSILNRTISTRARSDNTILRRHLCDCGKRFSTVEIVVTGVANETSLGKFFLKGNTGPQRAMQVQVAKEVFSMLDKFRGELHTRLLGHEESP